MVTLPNSVTAKEIYSLTSLFYLKIKVEAYKTTSPAQCFACQNFGYSSQQYGHHIRYIKNGGDHSTKVCIKVKDEKPNAATFRENTPQAIKDALFTLT